MNEKPKPTPEIITEAGHRLAVFLNTSPNRMVSLEDLSDAVYPVSIALETYIETYGYNTIRMKQDGTELLREMSVHTEEGTHILLNKTADHLHIEKWVYNQNKILGEEPIIIIDLPIQEEFTTQSNLVAIVQQTDNKVIIYNPVTQPESHEYYVERLQEIIRDMLSGL